MTKRERAGEVIYKIGSWFTSKGIWLLGLRHAATPLEKATERVLQAFKSPMR